MLDVFIKLIKILIFLFIVVFAVSYFINKPKIGEHVEKVEWLPTQATDISYYKTIFYELYEFSIDEKGFFRWLNDKNLSVATIDAESDKLFERYTTASCKDCNDTDTYVILKDGYYGHHENSSGNGGGWQVGYDLKTHRAYYSWSSH